MCSSFASLADVLEWRERQRVIPEHERIWGPVSEGGGSGKGGLHPRGRQCGHHVRYRAKCAQWCDAMHSCGAAAARGRLTRSWGFAGRERDGGHGDGRYEQSRAPRDVGGRRQGGHASTSTGRASRQQSQALSEAMEMAKTMSSQPGAAQAGWQDSRSGSAYSDGGRPPFRRSRSGGSRRYALCLCLSLLL